MQTMLIILGGFACLVAALRMTDSARYFKEGRQEESDRFEAFCLGWLFFAGLLFIAGRLQ